MAMHDSKEVNQRLTPDGNPESNFRQRIRDILDLDWSTRDEKIYEELRRLKRLERNDKFMQPADGIEIKRA